MKKLLLLSILVISLTIVQSKEYTTLISTVTNNISLEKQNRYNKLLGLNNSIAIQEIEINVNALLDLKQVSLVIDGETIEVERTNVVTYENGKDYVYCSYESDNADISISKLGNNIQGTINTSLGTYIIETIGEKSYLLVKLDNDEIPLDGSPLEGSDFDSPITGVDNSTTTSITSSDMKYVRVLVMYTPEALTLSTNMINKVYMEINNGNTSFQNSGINVRFELAYIGQTEDSENGYTFSQLLYNYRTDGDGFADEVHTLRERYSADVCVLLVKNHAYCGLGYVNSNYNTAFVAVNASSGCASKYSFTHEIGHNAGCQHDTLVSPTTYPYQYAHGYVHYTGTTSSSWRTMMAYGNACGGESYCQRIKYWSNPDVEYNGSPSGDTTWSNNARVWNNNATTVSSFYTNPSSITITSADNSTSMDYACWRATQNISASNYTIESGQIVEMIASSITLLPGTVIKEGAKFRAASAPLSPNAIYPLFAHRQQNSIEKSNNINLTIKILYNHLNLGLSLEKDCQYVTIGIYDVLGRLQKTIISNKYLSSGEHSFSTSLDNLSNGVYLLVTQINGKNHINKFSKQ